MLHRMAALRLKHAHWEIIADNLSKAGRSYGYISASDSQGRTIWIVDAHGYGKLRLSNWKRRFAPVANWLD
jgi:hypothetical protein